MIRRRCRGFSRPRAVTSSTRASITPSPRCRSISPSRTRSGSHASASTVPSRRTTAGAVTTGRQNSASSPASGAGISRHNGLAAAKQQVSDPQHDRSRRGTRDSGLRRPACVSNVRHKRMHEGSWRRDWTSTPEPLPGAHPAAKPSQNTRSQAHQYRHSLSPWCWVIGSVRDSLRGRRVGRPFDDRGVARPRRQTRLQLGRQFVDAQDGPAVASQLQDVEAPVVLRERARVP